MIRRNFFLLLIFSNIFNWLALIEGNVSMNNCPRIIYDVLIIERLLRFLGSAVYQLEINTSKKITNVVAQIENSVD
jgi:hypothetical protein